MSMGQIEGKQVAIGSMDGDRIKNAPDGIDTAQLNADAVDSSILDLADDYNFATGGGDIIVATTPATNGSAVNKDYVDSVAQGLDVKDSCAAVQAPGAGNRTLSGLSPAVDGVTLSDGFRVLLTDQTNAVQNGIWVAHTGAWTRPTDFAAGDSASGAFTFITAGSTWEASGWVCTTDPGSDVIDTNNLAFAQFSGAGIIEAGAGLTKSGNTLNVGELQGDGGGNPGGAIKANTDDIELQIAAAGGLEITDVSGDPGELRIKADGVTAAMLNADTAGLGLVPNGSTGALDVNPGAGIQISSDTVAVKADAVGGSNLAKAINVDGTNGVGVKVDDSSIEGDGTSGQLKVKADGITAAMLNADTAGLGLVPNGSTGALDVNPGAGIQISTDTVAVKPDAVGAANVAKAINVDVTNGVGVLIDADTVKAITANGRLVAAVPPSDDYDGYPTAPTSGDYQDTGIDITFTPAGDRIVRVYVNGIEVRIANGNRDQGACYFSVDAGATARAWSAITAGDSLYWNGGAPRGGYDLATTDRIDLVYNVAQVA